MINHITAQLYLQGFVLRLFEPTIQKMRPQLIFTVDMLVIIRQMGRERSTWSCIGVLVLLALLALAHCASYNYNFVSTIPATTSVYQFNQTVQVNTTTLGCLFKITTMQYSNVIMVTSLSPIDFEVSRSSLSEMYLASNPRLSMMDLQGTINNDPQLVNIPISSPNSTNYTIYFKFFNLDLPLVQQQKQYQLSIRTNTQNLGLYCFSCPYGATISPGSCQCAPCIKDYYGLSCQYRIITLNKAQQYEATIYSQTNLYYRIVSPPPNITLSFRENIVTNKITLYVQFQLKPGDLAGELNSYRDEKGNDHAWLVTTTQTEVSIQTEGRNLALTLHSQINTPTTYVSLSYRDPTSVSFTAVIIGVVVGLLSATIIIIIICIYRRKKQKEALPANPNQLTPKEIDYYFPEITASLVSQQQGLEQSTHKLIQEGSGRTEKSERGRKQQKEKECAVCLNQIEQQSRVRVTYCGHVFHGHCLVDWFKKTQNCPTCRNDCSRQPTEDSYQDLRAFRSPFRKTDLVRSIMSQSKHLNLFPKHVQPAKAGHGGMVAQSKVEMDKQLREQSRPDPKYEIQDTNEYNIAVELQSKPPKNPRHHSRRRMKGNTDFLSQQTSQEQQIPREEHIPNDQQQLSHDS